MQRILSGRKGWEMVSAKVRNKVWQDLLDLTRVSLYFDALYRRYRLRDLTIRIVLALAGFGVLSPLAELIPESFLGIVLGLCGSIVIVVAVSDLVFDTAGKRMTLRGVERSVKMYETELRQLWERVDAGVEKEDEPALNRSSEILRQAQESAEALSLHTDSRLNQKCAEEAYKLEMDRYGTAYATAAADTAASAGR